MTHLDWAQMTQASERFLTAEVATGRIIGGAICLCDAETGRLESVFAGYNSQQGSPVSMDSILRLYSMTKPMLATLALRLIDAGLLPGLDMPVADLARGITGVRVSARMTLRHLLTMSSGIAGSKYAEERIVKAYKEAGIRPFDYTDRGYAMDEAEFLRQILTCELAATPGSRWEYGRSGDVTGLLLQQYLARPLDELFHEYLFAPLAMGSSGFRLPDGIKQDSVLQPPQGPPSGEPFADLRERGGFTSGGSGGLASLSDYLTFLRTAFFRYQGDGFLSEESRAELLTDQIVGIHDTGPDYMPGPGWGYGLFCGIYPRFATPESTRQVRWLGRGGTSFFIDLKENIIVLFAAPCHGRQRRLHAVMADLARTYLGLPISLTVPTEFEEQLERDRQAGLRTDG